MTSAGRYGEDDHTEDEGEDNLDNEANADILYNPALSELEDSEFSDYFLERDERLFPSHGTYMLPVDGHEHGVSVDH
jgi:hypothetical protein